ncbi:hypothetical protein C8Q77DRAFT_1160961 [Trametes polyzona]|nr:hypothetical protein C8Q77DRAFT_1160961 [Trametes polyzona]
MFPFPALPTYFQPNLGSGMMLPSQTGPQGPGAVHGPDIAQHLFLQYMRFMNSGDPLMHVAIPKNVPLTSSTEPALLVPSPCQGGQALLTPSAGIEDKPRRQDAYPEVPYWTAAQWREEEKKKAPTPGQRKAHGATLVSQGINRTLPWLTYTDGRPVNGHDCTEIRRRAREFFLYLHNEGRAPDTWAHGADAKIKGEFDQWMRAHSVELQLCDRNWKAQKIATLTYPQWRSKLKKRLERHRTRDATSNRRKHQRDWSDDEDEDEQNVANVAKFLTGAKYTMLDSGDQSSDAKSGPSKRPCREAEISRSPSPSSGTLPTLPPLIAVSTHLSQAATMAVPEPIQDDTAASSPVEVTAPEPGQQTAENITAPAILQLPNVLAGIWDRSTEHASNVNVPSSNDSTTIALAPPSALTPPTLAEAPLSVPGPRVAPIAKADTKGKAPWPPRADSTKLKDVCARMWLREHMSGTWDEYDAWYKTLKHPQRVKYSRKGPAEKCAGASDAAPPPNASQLLPSGTAESCAGPTDDSPLPNSSQLLPT